MKKIILYIKKDTVLVAACLLALISAFMVPPSTHYFNYIDFRVLALLFCLMLVVTGLQEIGFFDNVIEKLLRRIHNIRQLVFLLVLICFFSSMLITNDVALITFVPFSILVLQKIKKESLMIFVIVMQTISANLGSMFTPLGNPQNLYLFSVSQIGIFDFIKIMFPITLVSFVLILICLLFVRNDSVGEKVGPLENIGPSKRIHPSEDVGEIENVSELEKVGVLENVEEFQQQVDYLESIKKNKMIKIIKLKMSVLALLFIICIGTVLHLIDYRLTLVIVIIVIRILDRKIIGKVDYMLLLTFVAFFIFVGNIKDIFFINLILESLIKGNEILMSIFSSQFISNVPAAILLSGFTEDYNALILGTNIGGLGTLIASMASLISYKFYIKTSYAKKGEYLGVFTGMNVIFLLVLGMFVYIII